MKAAEKLCEENRHIYEEKHAENRINQEKFFLNSMEVVHQKPFNETSYEVILTAIKEGRVIEFKLENAMKIFINIHD